MSKTMITVKNIEKRFGDLEVLKGISFEVNQGDVYAIIGPSGSGKSTLLRCLNQLEMADGGDVTICDKVLLSTDTDGNVHYCDVPTCRQINWMSASISKF